MTPERPRDPPNLQKPEISAEFVGILRKLPWTGNVIPLELVARIQRETSRRELASLYKIVPIESLEEISDFIKRVAEVHGIDAAADLLGTITDEIRLSKKGDQPIEDIVRAIIASYSPI